jgi:hypothetical protein
VTEQQLARMAKRRLAILRHAEEITGNVALTCRTPHHQPHPPNNRQPLDNIGASNASIASMPRSSTACWTGW